MVQQSIWLTLTAEGLVTSLQHWDWMLQEPLAEFLGLPSERYRLVAMDIRGHGLSDKPRDGYDDSRLWADDVKAVLESLSLDHPVISGWSYGPLVILDYIRHYGEERLGGIQFVGGI